MGSIKGEITEREKKGIYKCVIEIKLNLWLPSPGSIQTIWYS